MRKETIEFCYAIYIFDIRDHSNYTYSNDRRGEWGEGNVFYDVVRQKRGEGV